MTDRPAGLSRLVAAAPASLVLPDRPRTAAVDVPVPLRLVAAHAVGPRRFVAVVRDAGGARWTVPLVVEGDAVRRAVPGDGVAAALVRGEPAGDGFALEVWERADVDGEHGVDVDQTNESVVVGDRAVVKWLLRLPAAEDAGHPAARRLAALAAAGFAGVPSTWSLLRHGADLLAVVDEYLPGAEDGWTWAVDDVRALARGAVALDDAVAPAAELGRLTAEMHLALAAGSRDRATAHEAAAWADRALADLAEAVEVVDGPEGERLRARAGRIGIGLASLGDAEGTVVADVHGDLHVGQWLRYGTPPGPWSYAVTDFDGSPVASSAERDGRQPAARDVASMLASLDHVGRIVVHRDDGVDATVVGEWVRAAEAAFLQAYRATLAAAGAAELLDERLLRPLRLQQECRELLYAVRHLPLWRYVPDAALADLLPDQPAEED